MSFLKLKCVKLCFKILGQRMGQGVFLISLSRNDVQVNENRELVLKTGEMYIRRKLGYSEFALTFLLGIPSGTD